MPTRDNVTQLESLIEATMALIEMKRIVDKVDYDIQVLRARLGLKEEQEGEEVKVEGMDVDESMAEGEPDEDGRAQSVASARSGRGSRKQVSLDLFHRFRRQLIFDFSLAGLCRFLQSTCPHGPILRDRNGVRCSRIQMTVSLRVDAS
jgi:hypothetical protein